MEFWHFYSALTHLFGFFVFGPTAPGSCAAPAPTRKRPASGKFENDPKIEILSFFFKFSCKLCKSTVDHQIAINYLPHQGFIGLITPKGKINNRWFKNVTNPESPCRIALTVGNTSLPNEASLIPVPNHMRRVKPNGKCVLMFKIAIRISKWPIPLPSCLSPKYRPKRTLTGTLFQCTHASCTASQQSDVALDP